MSGKILAEAAAQKAQAEVEAAKAAHAAAALRAQAEAEAAKAAHAVAALRAQAEAEAAAQKAQAEVEAAKAAHAAAALRAQAEAEAAKAAHAAAAQRSHAVTQKAQAEAYLATQAVAAPFWAAVACAAVCVFLTCDYLVHEERNLIRLQIKRKLAACLLPAFIPARVEENRLPLDQAPLFLQLHPVLMLGPSGCGKITQLMDLARQHIAAKTPTLFVELRMSRPNALE